MENSARERYVIAQAEFNAVLLIRNALQADGVYSGTAFDIVQDRLERYYERLSAATENYYGEWVK